MIARKFFPCPHSESPTIWKDLFKEYQNGKFTKSIHFLTLNDCMELQLKDVKIKYERIKN